MQVFSLDYDGQPAVWGDVSRECVTSIQGLAARLGGGGGGGAGGGGLPAGGSTSPPLTASPITPPPSTSLSNISNGGEQVTVEYTETESACIYSINTHCGH